MKTIQLKFRYLIPILIVVVIVGIYLKYKYVDTKIVEGEGSVQQIEYYKHWITFTPSNGANISDFVDMSYFYNFKPGTDFKEAVDQFGEPDNLHEDEHNQYFEYFFPNTRIEIAREESSSGSEDPNIDWALYSYPKDLGYGDYFSSSSMKYIEPYGEITSVTILNHDGDPQLLAYLKGNRIDHIIWYRE
jgi:hypothetical protein